jgi:hemerythrin superfamily protein
MNAIEMLTKQHRDIEAAFKAVKGAEAPARHRLFVKAADILMSHVLIEERLFYPAVNAKRTEDILLESLEEHLSLKRVLADLVAMSPDAPGFEPKFHVLAEQAEHHHEEEEEKLFPKVKKVLGSDELEQLGERMRALQAELLTKEPRTLAAEQTDEAAALPGIAGTTA